MSAHNLYCTGCEVPMGKHIQGTNHLCESLQENVIIELKKVQIYIEGKDQTGAFMRFFENLAEKDFEEKN